MIPADASEILDVFGPRVNFLSSLELGEAEFTLIAGLAANVAVRATPTAPRAKRCLWAGSMTIVATA
jgi:hypothetical protein